MHPRTLLLATTSYAGMGPYVASIVNSFAPDDNVYFFLVEDNRHYYSKNIKPELKRKCCIIHEHLNKLKTLYYLTLHPKYFYHDEVKKKCNNWNIELVHCLTSIHDIELLKWILKTRKALYTVHDLRPHEAKKAFYKEWRQTVNYKRVFSCIDIAPNILTNSECQLKELESKYPDKQHFYVDFPTLITDKIANGSIEPKEILYEKDYFLFFGRIEAYKGVETLVEAFNKLGYTKSCKLVIAGSGTINTKITNSNIIFINRYIDDGEISALYKKARCIIYPYLSATQSGVLSVAAYFGKPMILSNIPFFTENIKNHDFVFYSEPGNPDSLKLSIEDFINSAPRYDEFKNNSLKFYQTRYSNNSYKEHLQNIYSKVL